MSSKFWLKIRRHFCKHTWSTQLYSYGAYDQEVWEECTKCGKQAREW